MPSPTRVIKCQICPWNRIRGFGAKGILCEPCPECGHRVTYAIQQAGDQPVSPDTGEVRQPSKPRKILSLEHRAKLAAGQQAVRAA